MKYRKKPVVIEAIKFTEETKDRVFNFITCNRMPTWDDSGKPAIVISTLEGEMKATIGDYVIKGVNGEFYPCKPDIFEKTYDPINNEPYYGDNKKEFGAYGVPKNLNPPPCPPRKDQP